jgi:hypothetical protein
MTHKSSFGMFLVDTTKNMFLAVPAIKTCFQGDVCGHTLIHVFRRVYDFRTVPK